MKFLRQVSGIFAADMGAVGLQFLVGVLVARLLIPADRGVLALVMVLPVTLAHFADLGISQSIVFFIGKQRFSTRQVMGNAVLLAVVVGSTLALGLWLARDRLAAWLSSDLSPAALGWALVVLPVALVDAYLLSFLRARQEFGWFNLRRLASPLLMLLVFLGLVLTRGASAETAVQAFVFSLLASAGLSFGLVVRRVSLRPRFEPAVLGPALRFGLKSYLQNLVGHLHYRIDIYLLALFLPLEQVAFYTVAVGLSEFAFYLPNAVGLALFPRLAAEKEDRIFALTAQAARHTLFTTALLALGMLLTGWAAIPLIYGREYLPSVYPFMVILPGVLAMALFKVLTRSYTSRDRQQTSIQAAGLALGANLALNLALIPWLGVVGAALASWLSYSLAALALAFFFSRESGIPLRQVLFLTRSDLDLYLKAWGRLAAVWSGRNLNKQEKLASQKERFG
jgi:stage V sporulation protein B